MIALLLTLALAQSTPEPRKVAVSAGLDWVANDAYLNHRGLNTGLQFRPQPSFGFSANVGIYPSFGESDRTSLTRDLITNNDILPAISKVTGQQTAMVHWIAIQSEGTVRTELGLMVGGGLVQTRDDLSLTQQQGLAKAKALERQTHPQLSFGVSAEATRSIIGFRARYQQTRYSEQRITDGLSLEKTTRVWFGADLVFWVL